MANVNRRQVVVFAGATAAAVAVGEAAFVMTRSKSAVVRPITAVHPPLPHVDGAGVKLKKLLGHRGLPLLDPFLMLDEFRSRNPRDFERGFPNHPHRGFETVTLMLDGHVLHRDSVGNTGDISGGGVQWMTAGRGIIHSEMPRASESSGELWGYQLWVNLPAALKMTKPRYQDLPASAFLTTSVADARVRVLAGRAGGAAGAVQGVHTSPTVLDVSLQRGARFVSEVPSAHTAFGVVASGSIESAERSVVEGHLFTLGSGDRIELLALEPSRLLLFAGSPLGEPVARRGPFVMNNDEELRQAFDDYRYGRLLDG